MCPMITVLPCRLNFQNLGGILTRAQEDTSHTVEHEHVALSKINRWVHPDQGLFETLFSVSFQDNSRSSLWDVIGSENPKPEVSYFYHYLLSY